jgi:AcrR family transcriptional regulator
MTDEKTTRAVQGAADTFLRYGYARTTMGDIARAAGMSRPALYLLFPGKEHLFAAATMFMADRRLEETRQALRSCRGLPQKLTTACEMLLVGFFELQQAAPDARDMDNLAFPVVREIYAKFEAFFAAIITECGGHPSAAPEKIARVLLYGARGYREVAASTDEFRDLIRTHVAMMSVEGSGPPA